MPTVGPRWETLPCDEAETARLSAGLERSVDMLLALATGLVLWYGATLALPPTSSVEAAAARLSALPTGGRTPLAAGTPLTAGCRSYRPTPLLRKTKTVRPPIERCEKAQPGHANRKGLLIFHPLCSI